LNQADALGTAGFAHTKAKKGKLPMRKRVHPLIWVFMSGLIFYFIITLARQQGEISLIQAEMQVIAHKISQEEKKRDELLEQKIKANTDAFIESIAREKLGMVKEGERLFVDSE